MSRPEYLERALAPYDADPEKFSKGWRKTTTERVWQPILPLFRQPPRRPTHPPTRLLDAPAGDGRDAEFFRNAKYEVTAAEPSRGLRQYASEHGAGSGIRWIDSAFPGLTELKEEIGAQKFHMVTVSAGFVHLPPETHQASLQSIYDVLEPRGRAAITLRMGEPDPARFMYRTDAETLTALAREVGFEIVKIIKNHPDPLGRQDCPWDHVMLERPRI